MTGAKFTLRAMQPADSAGVARLIEGFGGGLVTRFRVEAYAALTAGTEYRTVGVVAETPGYDGLAGMGTVRFGRAQFNGEVLPLAFLDGLKVLEQFRGQGLGVQLAAWRVQQARAAFGDRGLIATGMLHDNRASYAVARKWCREFAEPAYGVRILPVRRQPPRPLAGISVGVLEPRQYEAFAAQQNQCFQRFQLYAPVSAETIAQTLSTSVGSLRPYRYWAATDRQGNLVAGAQTWARGLLKADRLTDPPPPLRLMNRVFRLVPPDFTVHEVAVTGLWFAPQHLAAARQLWETVRWEARTQGTSLAISFDPRDPAQAAVRVRPWHQPRPQITLALHGPAPLERDRPLFGLSRV